MTVPPVPDYQTNQQSNLDFTILRRQVRTVREALVRARHELETQITSLDKVFAELDRRVRPSPHATPFEAPPSLLPEPAVKPALTIDYLDEPPGQIVLEATNPAAIEQHLEQATLEELNHALAKAFSQVSGRLGW